MCHRAVWYKSTDFSEKCAASIVKSTLGIFTQKMKAEPFQTSRLFSTTEEGMTPGSRRHLQSPPSELPVSRLTFIIYSWW